MTRVRLFARRFALGALALLLLAAVLLDAPRAGLAVSSAAHCGVERWTVKTLQDSRAGRVDYHARSASVTALRLLPARHVTSDTPRLAGETITYRVPVQLVAFKAEADSDVHLVIADPRHASRTMIAEFPAAACATRASASARRKMRAARQALTTACGEPSSSQFTDLSGAASITGVAFYDVLHGQNGVAPNGIELHPVLRFRLTSGCRAG